MIELFSTCPVSTGGDGAEFRQRVAEVAQWSEGAGCKGILVYSDNTLVDPWLLAHIIVQHTSTLSPVVAVQPVYMHPYWVAKQVASLAHLYGRRVYLNMVAGGYGNDLEALNDTTPHDKRSARLVEYTTIIMRLLADPSPVTVVGRFYSVLKMKMAPPVLPALVPGVFVSGSVQAEPAAARMLGATAVKYPGPADQEKSPPEDLDQAGIHVGIITRQDDAEAWAIARERFLDDRGSQPAQQRGVPVSDSSPHEPFPTAGGDSGGSPYWLVPFRTRNMMCPYLVGSYERVAKELARYLELRCRTFILDLPHDREELGHINVAFERARGAIEV